MLKSVFDFLLIIGAIHGFLFVLFPILTKKKVEKPIWYLNAFVFFISLNNLQAWLIEKGYVCPLFFVKHMEVPWYVLIVPSFYVFLFYYLKLKWNVTFFVRLVWILFSLEIIVKSFVIVFCYYNGLRSDLIDDYTKIEEVVNICISIFLFVKTLIIVFRKKSSSDKTPLNDDIKWLRQFMIFGLVVILFWIVAVVLNLLFNTFNHLYYYPLRLSSSLLIYWVGYQGLIRYNLMQDRISLRKELVKSNVNITPIPPVKTFKEDKLLEKYSGIDNHVISNKRYLDPLFSLNDLADEVGISSSQTSKLINNYSGNSFPDYINRLRVEYAKQLLRNEQYNKYTMVALALECGFNSKSTFYTAFKKFTNKKPTEFREV